MFCFFITTGDIETVRLIGSQGVSLFTLSTLICNHFKIPIEVILKPAAAFFSYLHLLGSLAYSMLNPQINNH